jgi:hypothetical protein
MANKPVVKGPVDGNAHSIIAAAGKAMRREGIGADKISEMSGRALAGDYNNLLNVVQEYVELDIGLDDDDDEDEEEGED